MERKQDRHRNHDLVVDLHQGSLGEVVVAAYGGGPCKCHAAKASSAAEESWWNKAQVG